MGLPVVHFEILGEDGVALQSFYSELFGWRIDANNPMNYGTVQREENLNADGVGIGGGIAQVQPGQSGYVTVYVEVLDVEAALAKAERLGGTRLMGPSQVPGGPELGIFNDPEGNVFGLIKSGT